MCIGLFRAFFPEAQRGMQDVAAVAVYGIDAFFFCVRSLFDRCRLWEEE